MLVIMHLIRPTFTPYTRPSPFRNSQTTFGISTVGSTYMHEMEHTHTHTHTEVRPLNHK